jgi:hypothetical protein
LLLLGSSFIAFSWAMEDDNCKCVSISKIVSKLKNSLGKKKFSKKRIQAIRIAHHLSKGRRKGISE